MYNYVIAPVSMASSRHSSASRHRKHHHRRHHKHRYAYVVEILIWNDYSISGVCVYVKGSLLAEITCNGLK